MAIPYTPTANAYKPPVSPTGGSTSPLPTNKTQTYSPLPTNTQPATAPKFGDPIPFTLGQKTVFPTAPTAPVPTNPSFMSKVGSTVKGVGDFITSSEQAFGNDIAAGASAVLPDSLTGKAQIDTANKLGSDSDLHYVQTLIKGRNDAITQGKDTTHYDTQLRNFKSSTGTNLSDLYPALNKTNLQVLGDAGGVLADVLSVGSYGQVAKDVKASIEAGKLIDTANASGKLITKAGGVAENLATKVGLPTVEKAVTPVVEAAAKQTLPQALKTIGKETGIRSAIGGATGYGYDVVNNAQSGKTGMDVLKPGAGTVTGVILPLAIGSIRAGMAVTKDVAPRLINSLVKPKQADFSYGKNPGRTVSQMGITGNNLDDFANNIKTAKEDVGKQIGSIYQAPENAGVRINTNGDIAKLDTAINDAAKGGKNNQTIVTQLQNLKDSLLYNHQVNTDGVIVRTSDVPRDLSNLTAQEAFDLKQKVAEATQFTGRPSDDKTVNSVLKNIYGGIKEKLNNSLKVNNPEITDLNQKYADLTSAEIATRNRDKIIQRTDIISMPIKVGGAAGIITAISSGGAAIPVILAGVGAASLDKAMQSTLVKTRIASWLGSESPSIITKTLQQNPAIKEVLYRVLPRFASKLRTE